MSVLQPRIWGPCTTSLFAYFLSPFPRDPVTLSLNDADDSIALVLLAPKAGNITHVGFYSCDIVGSPPDYNIGLVTLDGSGNPTTTAFGGSTHTTWTPPAGLQWQWVALAGAAAAAVGDWLCIRIWPTASAPDGSNYAKVARYYTALDSDNSFWNAEYSTLWSKNGSISPVAVRYSDGSEYGCQSTVITGWSFDSADTPDEAGALITLPFACECCGMVVGIGGPTSPPYDLCLYSSAGNLLGTWSLSDEDYGESDWGSISGRWAPVTLAAGSYYATVKATNAVQVVTVPALQFTSAVTRAGSYIPEAANVIGAYRTDGGAWTTDDTVLPWVGLLLSDITFGSSGGGPRWL